MAILQSTLPIPQLRLDTLRTWLTFFTVLRFPDVGPHIGTTAAAFVVVWQEMTREEASHAAKLLDYLLVENSDQLGGFFDEVVSLDSIPELTLAAKRVADYTAKWSFKDRVTAILRRCRSDNVALATRSIYDMKQVLLAHQAEILELAKGDSFNVLVGQIYRVLLEVAGRDGEHTEDIRIGSFECIGIIGALDPDRFTLPSKEKTFMMLSNFTDSDEVRDFALHLVDRVLVGAFRTANDTKQQIQLAYAIQELTKFCGFSPKLLQSNSSSGSIALKVRQRWQEFTRNKQTLETITPLLEGRYGVEKIPIKHFQYPIYASSSTYREWIRSWTTDLISVVLEQPEPLANDADERSKALRDAQTIFGSFRGVVRSGQDVAVAHHLLPHLVLYVINLGDEAIRKNIVMEIGSVLQDQVNPTGNFDSDRRTLSAQVGLERRKRLLIMELTNFPGDL
jgi:serine/threonine-protein kinase ATR